MELTHTHIQTHTHIYTYIYIYIYIYIYKIKAHLNDMKLKAQTEILEDESTHYKTKYEETNHRNSGPLPHRNSTILKGTMGKELQKRWRKIKKNPEQKTTWLKNLPQK